MKLRILIPVLNFGKTGGSRVLSRLSSEWVESGHEVSFVAPQFEEGPYFPTSADIIWIDSSGNPVTHSSEQPKRGPTRVAISVAALAKAVARLSFRFDVVLATHSLTAWAVLFAPSSSKRFYYVQAYEPEFYWAERSIKSAILGIAAWLSYLLPMRKIVNAPIYMKYRNLRSRYVAFPGIDLNVFHPKTRDCRRNGQYPIRLGCIGRKERIKGTHLVVAAFAALKRNGYNVTLNVAYGNLPPDAAAMDGVSTTDPTNDSELAEFYRSVDILIAPGLIQFGSPHYPVMEAMASGTCVVTTGYLPATPDNSVIVQPCHEAISIALADLIKDPSKCSALTTAALEAIQTFSWPRVAAHFIGLLTTASNASARP